MRDIFRIGLLLAFGLYIEGSAVAKPYAFKGVVRLCDDKDCNHPDQKPGTLTYRVNETTCSLSFQFLSKNRTAEFHIPLALPQQVKALSDPDDWMQVFELSNAVILDFDLPAPKLGILGSKEDKEFLLNHLESERKRLWEKQKTSWKNNRLRIGEDFPIGEHFLLQTDRGELQFAANTKTKYRYDLNPEHTLNQDHLVLHQFNGTHDLMLSVYDGHGENGELSAHYVGENFPIFLNQDLANPSATAEVIEQSFQNATYALEDYLLSGPLFNHWASGTTAGIALLRKNLLHIASIGDSRIVLGVAEDNELKPFQPIADHEIKGSERDRIEASGGYVARWSSGAWMYDETLPFRVYEGVGKTGPGLNMSRSIGDSFAKNYGVIALPDFATIEMTPEHKFIIVASDGLWVLDNKTVVEIVGKYLEAKDSLGAITELISTASKRWDKLENGHYRDDISIAICFL